MKALLVVAVLLTACSRSVNDGVTTSTGTPQDDRTLGIGRAATPAEIAALDIDVRPDGAGLPPGSGTASAGRAIYADQCASCHGADGEGTPRGVRLVGRIANDAFPFGAEPSGDEPKTIGSYWPYATTVYDYTSRAMPFDRPGSLSADEVYAVVAWMLWKNRIISEDQRMDRTSLPAVRMPARDRFVRDDRELFRHVR